MTPSSLQVGDRRLGGEPGVGPAQVLANLGVTHREALDVGLVDDRVGERHPRRRVPLPVEGRVDHDRLRDRAGVVLVVGLVVVVLAAVGDVREHVGVVRPVDDAVDRLRVRVDQQLVGVEAVAVGGCVGTVHAEAVALPGPDAGQVAMPVERPPGGDLDPGLGAGVVEQAQLDCLGVLGEQREVGPGSVPRCAERERPPGPDLGHLIKAPDIGGSLRYPSERIAQSSVASSIVVAPALQPQPAGAEVADDLVRAATEAQPAL